MAWLAFIKDSQGKIDLWCSLVHGICLVITDGLANVLRGDFLFHHLREVKKLLESSINHHDCQCLQWVLSSGGLCRVTEDTNHFGIRPFTIAKRPGSHHEVGSFHFQTETVAKNTLKLLRGLQVN